MQRVRDVFLQLPMIGRFAIVYGLIVVLSKLAERFALPGVVGSPGGGIVLGPNVLNLIGPKGGSVELFAELGKQLQIFFAGCEVDLEQFKRVRWKGAGYGLLTFSIPLVLGTADAVRA